MYIFQFRAAVFGLRVKATVKPQCVAVAAMTARFLSDCAKLNSKFNWKLSQK
jgi:hypothetical protein